MTGISQVDNIKNSVISGKTESPEEEDGFVDIFTEYNYDNEIGQKGNLHIHKYDPELVQEAVDAALKIRDGGN